MTLRAHANPPIVAISLDLNREVADKKFWMLVEKLYEQLPALNDFGASGVHVIFPQMPVPPTNGTSGGLQAQMTVQFLFVDQPSVAAVRAAIRPLEAAFRSASSDGKTHSDPPGFAFRATAFPSVGAFYAAVLPASDRGGALTAMGSRLVSRDFIASASGARSVADAFSRLRLAPGEAVSGNIVAGGAVARAGDAGSVNPAWRRTLSHVSIVRGWGANATLAEQERVQTELTGEMVPILKGLKLRDEPEMGSYLNEANAREPDFQKSFWGLENYRRLYAIKKRWDPDGLFIVRKGVGSEDWDDDGLCRVASCAQGWEGGP